MTDENDEGFELPEERRAYDRSRLIVDVFFDGKDATGVASSQDMSLGGFYLNTQTAIPEGSLLLIRIPFGPGKQVVCNAEVVYTKLGRGVGVRFQGLSDEARRLLETELTKGS